MGEETKLRARLSRQAVVPLFFHRMRRLSHKMCGSACGVFVRGREEVRVRPHFAKLGCKDYLVLPSL